MLLLIILDIGQIYAVHSIAEVRFGNIAVSSQIERNLKTSSFFNTKFFKILLIVELFGIDFVQNKAHGTFDPEHYLIAFPQDFGSFNIDLHDFV